MSVLSSAYFTLLSPSNRRAARYLLVASFSTSAFLFAASAPDALRASSVKPFSSQTSFIAASCRPGFPPAPLITSTLALNSARYEVSDMCSLWMQSMSSLSARTTSSIACAVSSRLCVMSRISLISMSPSWVSSISLQVFIPWSFVSISGEQWEINKLNIT